MQSGLSSCGVMDFESVKTILYEQECHADGCSDISPGSGMTPLQKGMKPMQPWGYIGRIHRLLLAQYDSLA